MWAARRLAIMDDVMGNVILGMFIVAVAALCLSGAGRFLVTGMDDEDQATLTRERAGSPAHR